MKKLFLLLTGTLLVLLSVSSCSTLMSSMELSNAKSRAEEHKYAEALDSAVSSLTRSEYKSTDAADLILEIVMQGDAYYNSIIQQYRTSDKGNAFAEIYNNYVALVNLYSAVTDQNLQNFTAGGKNYSIEIKDYSTDLNSARDVAGKVYYEAAISNMDTETLAGYRQAYNNLVFVRSMYSNAQSPFSDLDSIIEKARNEGTIDICIVVPTDLKMDPMPDSMGDMLKANVEKQSDWVKFHYGNQIDTVYQLWEIGVAGEDFLDAASGKIINSNGLLEFGREINADIVIYAAFDELKNEKIKVTDKNYKFDGISGENEEYVLDLNWKKHSKETSLRYSYYVVDVKSGDNILRSTDKTAVQNIVLYAGTYTLTPDIWSTQSTKNFAEDLNITDIKEYRYIQAGYNGWAYRTDYEDAGLEERDKSQFDEQKASFEFYAGAEAQFIIASQVARAISASIANLF